MKLSVVGTFTILLALAAAFGCTPWRQPSDASGAAPAERVPSFAPLGEPTATVERRSAGGTGYTYRFTREPNPVDGALRAVGIGNGIVCAAGDDGILLTRGPTTGWTRMESGTRHTLRAFGPVWARDRILLVGNHGTILVKTPDRGWTLEPSGTTDDLYATGEVGSTSFVAGAHGQLLMRMGSGWSSIPSGTEEDLHALWDCSYHPAAAPQTSRSAICAAGAAGTIVRCAFDATVIRCEKQPSSTTDTLFAYARPFLVGGRGTLLRVVRDERFERFVAFSSVGTDLFALAKNHALWVGPHDDIFVPDHLAVGAAGKALFLRGEEEVTPIQLGVDLDLFGATQQGLDVFVVGARGLILHGAVRGVEIPMGFMASGG